MDLEQEVAPIPVSVSQKQLPFPVLFVQFDGNWLTFSLVSDDDPPVILVY